MSLLRSLPNGFLRATHSCGLSQMPSLVDSLHKPPERQRTIMPTVTRENLGEHRDSHTKNNSWWLSDVRGIPLTRVCEDCIDAAKSTYKPEVLGEGEGRYEDAVEDQIEDDY